MDDARQYAKPANKANKFSVLVPDIENDA